MNKENEITPTNNYYVYIHRRKDNNTPFYVGKGKGKRAWSVHGRNKYWENIASKYGYYIELVFENLEEDEAFQCEKDVILEFEYFGYNLTNLTKGGEGVSGHIPYNIDLQNYTFYHLNGNTFNGTRKEFSQQYKVLPKDISKLFQTVNNRKSVKNWALSPLILVRPSKKALVMPQRRSTNVDKTIYTFYKVSGDIFTGTRSEFSDYSQIPLVTISGLFCKNPRKTIYGWAITPITWDNLTHVKT